jgi:hypothetical protein
MPSGKVERLELVMDVLKFSTTSDRKWFADMPLPKSLASWPKVPVTAICTIGVVGSQFRDVVIYLHCLANLAKQCLAGIG